MFICINYFSAANFIDLSLCFFFAISVCLKRAASQRETTPIQWRHYERDGVSNEQPHDCLLKHLFRHLIKENIEDPRHCPLWGEFTGEFPAQRASNAENVSIWWRHHALECGASICSDVFKVTCDTISIVSHPLTKEHMHALTHWGRVTHICVGKLTTIGSDNGLSPGRRQAIIRTNAGILLIRPLGTNFSEFLVEILIFSFKKMRLKVSSAKRRPFCLGLNELMIENIGILGM